MKSFRTLGSPYVFNMETCFGLETFNICMFGDGWMLETLHIVPILHKITFFRGFKQFQALNRDKFDKCYAP